MSRLFVAVQLSDEIKKAVTASLHDLKKQGVKGNYVPAANLHLTLAFIGETSDIAGVKAALSGVKYKPFRLTFSDMGAFGDLLYVGAKGNQGLSQAVKAVRGALDEAGISYDKKKFVPHITVIRKASGFRSKMEAPKGEMPVSRISLMKSEEKNGRRVYTEIFSI